jgi:hypothetical protein
MTNILWVLSVVICLNGNHCEEIQWDFYTFEDCNKEAVFLLDNTATSVVPEVVCERKQ